MDAAASHSDASLPTLDDACGALLFDERDFDLAALSAPLDALFGGGARPAPTLEWDAVLGGLPTLPVVDPVRRVKSEPVLNAPRDPPSPLSSVTEGSAESESSSLMPLALSSASPPPSAPPSAVPMVLQTPAAAASADAPSNEQRKVARAKALARFRSKRASRSFAKRVRYECRKQLADSRPRVKGRFVKKSEMALYRKYGDLYRNFMHELESNAASTPQGRDV